MSQEAASDRKMFDVFELSTALLLGFAAVGAAWAGFQNGQWGGRQAEAFSEAATMTTKASNDYNEMMSTINHDYAIDIQAKKAIFEAMDEEDEARREHRLEMASNLYTRYLSVEAYEELELPEEYVTPEEVDGKEADFVEAKVLPEKMLVESLESELGDEYIDDMLSDANAAFAAADKRFAEGRIANDTGDKFSLIQVFYTLSLFFAGLGLVFKTRMRWGFFSAGLLVLIYSTFSMFRVPWA
jgi:hypothetical protein